MKKLFLLAGLTAITGACSTLETSEPVPVETERRAESAASTNSAALDTILAAQDDSVKARYQYRHPKETLQFIGIEPGMSVIDILPGGGYYSKILLPYLGSDGQVIGVDYNIDMWPLFGGFANAEFLEAKKTWAQTWSATANGWRAEGDASISAFAFGDVPEGSAGSVDGVLMVRAFHHLNRFEDEGGFRDAALKELYTLLKSDGIIGIVQHRAPEGNDDVWAEGDNGYVKQSLVIEKMEAAGFVFVGSSEINANPKDQPTNEDFVWRLPPTLGTSRDNPELRAKLTEIGETDRMTLKFRKP